MSSFSHPDRTLDLDDLLDDPIEQVRRWLEEAEMEDVPLANAMTLATADADGRPSARHVLLRGLDERGFVFYTNHESRKGLQLAHNPFVALVFLWKELDRQISITGRAERASDDESDAYFSTRPRDAQLGAWASRQSEVLEGRRALDLALEDADRRFPGEVPRPPFWGGYRVVPDTIEFWQGRAFRLHDRFRYTHTDTGWLIERLSP
ncbi:MAG TPA: pyridoxamine 5'-phosphate oxidase [Actinomycetota bacterium]